MAANIRVLRQIRGEGKLTVGLNALYISMTLRNIIVIFIKLSAPFYALFHCRPRLFKHILIQTNNVCTRICPWCIYGISNKKDTSVLPELVFKKIIDELAIMNYSGRISLFEINEPLTDERIFDFIRYASLRLPAAWHFVNTNGDLLTEEKIGKLFEAGLDALDISSYDVAAYERINKLLSKISMHKGKIRHFNKTAKEFLTDNRGGNLTNIFKPKIRKAFCDRVNKILFIKPSGDAVSCFGDFFNANIMGNVINNTLKEIWWGERFEGLRKRLNRCDRTVSRLCMECNYAGYGGYYKIPFIKHLKKKFNRKK